MKRRPCPTPDKQRLRTPHHAVVAGHSSVRNANAEGRLCPPLYWYACRCGSIHLTRRATTERDAQLGIGGVACYVSDELQRWAFPKRESA